MILKLEDGTYEGDVKHGQPHGYGKLTYNDEFALYYEGEWKQGMRHGTGKIAFKNGEACEGVWEDDAFVFGKEEGEYGYYVGYFADGERNGFGEETCYNGRTWKGMWKNGKKIAHEKSEPLPNAVRVWPLGNIDLVHIEDFSSQQGLGAPLNCERVDIISTAEMKELSEIMEVTIVGYIDSNANQKDFVNNSLMCELSGYDYLPGACILCGFNKDYAPLDVESAELLFDCLIDVQNDDE